MNIEQISKETGIELEELKKLQEHLLNKYRTAIEDEEILLKLVERGVKQYAKRTTQKGGKVFYGIVLSYTQAKNSTKRRRDKALELYKNDSENAISKGYIEEFTKTEDGKILSRKLDKNGHVVTREVLKIHENAVQHSDKFILPLDSEPNFKSGKKNYRYLEPLAINEHFVNIEGLYSDGNSDFTPFKMIMNTNTQFFSIPIAKPVKFMAKEKERGVLTPTSMTNFEVIEGDIDKSLIDKYYPVIPFSSLEQHVKTYKTVVVEGQVMDLFINSESGWSSVTLQELTSDDILRVTFHPNIEINFGTESIIKAFGTASKGKKWDTEAKQLSETEEEVSMFGTGYYPIVLIGADEKPEEIQEVEEDDEWEN